MITPILKFSEIKKNPNELLGLKHALICKYGDVVAHVVSPERMKELISIEDKHKVSDIDTAYACAVDALEMVDSSKNPDLFYEIEQIIIACIGDDEFNKIKMGNSND